MDVADGGGPYDNQSNEFISTPAASVTSSRKRADMRRSKRRGRGEGDEEEVAGRSGEMKGSSLSRPSQSADPLPTSTLPTSTLTFLTPHTQPPRQHTNTTAIFGPPVNFGSAPSTSNVPPLTGGATRSTSKFQPSYEVPPSPSAQQWRSCDRVSPSVRKIDLPEGKRTPV